jgi:predicted transcriptional regulator
MSTQLPDQDALQSELAGLQVRLDRTPEVRSGDKRTQVMPGSKVAPATNVVLTEQLINYFVAGYSVKNIAKLTGISYTTIRKYAHDDEFLQKLREVSKETAERVREELVGKMRDHQERVNELSHKALDTLELLMDSQREGIALKAAVDVLDRNPDTPRGKNIQADVTQRIIDPAMLMHAAVKAEELRLTRSRQTEPQTVEGEVK